jgi:type II secretion system protein G
MKTPLLWMLSATVLGGIMATALAGDDSAPKAKPILQAKAETGKSATATAIQVAFIHEELENLKTQLRLYEIRNGSLPSTEQGLKALVERPADQPVPHRWRRLLADVPKDPWNHEYRLEVPATRSRDAFDLLSAGPDGQFGTADDLGNW